MLLPTAMAASLSNTNHRHIDVPAEREDACSKGFEHKSAAIMKGQPVSAALDSPLSKTSQSHVLDLKMHKTVMITTIIIE